MDIFALFRLRQGQRYPTQRLQPAPLAPRRLERRRVLDAGAAGLLLGSVADTVEYVQTGENIAAGGIESDKEANQAPTNVELLLGSSEVFENEMLQLGVTFEDVNDSGTHKILIDWGDGTPTEKFSINPGARFLGTSHQYLDDNPTSTPFDINEIKVRVVDSVGNRATASAQVTVHNLPSVLSVAEDQVIDEGSRLDLSDGGLGSFTDLGKLDSHTAIVYWGDGTTIETVTINQGQGTGTLDGSHRFADNGLYTVTVLLKDDDGGAIAKSFQVTVNNVAPELVVVGNQTVDEGALLQISNLGSFTDPGFDNPHNTLDPENGGQTFERFFYKIDWGDNTLTNVVPATLDQPGGPGVATEGSFDGAHIYADNGLYTVEVQLFDDDGGVATETFQVQVNNVAPTLDGVEPIPRLDEGTAFTLNDLGITLSDPGFDNLLNPLVLGGSQETFTALTVDWGDGTPVDPLNIVNRVDGSPGVATTAEFEHSPHTYADNGLYTVTITAADDDGGAIAETFQIEVHNVAPTLVLTSRDLEISESETLNLFDLGAFSDPGFNNLLNTGNPSNGGEVTETFSYTIDWGDGTVETGQLPATVLSGSAGIETLGTLVDSHQYLDNDSDNLFTVTVTLSDDDGGTVEDQIIITRVLNVDPTLEPITATDVNTKGETTLTLEFADPGTETLTVWVDWGDKIDLPPAQRYVPETFVLGPGTHNLTLMHTYAGPPDPLHPAADIVLSVFIRDDDFGGPLVVGPGQSETQMVTISNAGLGTSPVVIDTTPQVPRLVFPKIEESLFFAESSSGNEGGSQTTELSTAVGDTKSTTDRFLELRVIDSATGEQSEGYRLKPEVLKDMPGLFRTLPDNHYAIYLVRTETNTRRLVIEVYVRNGKLIDPGDDSEGTRDRPPTDEAVEEVTEPPKQEVLPEEAPILNPAQPEAIDVSQQRTLMLLGPTLVGIAATKSGRSWANRIDQALATADAKKWQRLRRRYRHNRNSSQGKKEP